MLTFLPPILRIFLSLKDEYPSEAVQTYTPLSEGSTLVIYK